MMMPENGHRAHGFSSAFFLDSDEIIQELNLNGNETIMDAGCGDGHNAIKILEDYNHKGTRKLDEAVIELSRIIKNDGKIAIMDYKAWDVPKGPPTPVRSSPEELEQLFNKHGLKMTYLNEEIGEDIPEGKSHYLIMFQKE